MSKSTNIITIYACGGAGVNLGQYIERVTAESVKNFSEVRLVYVDTSTSNMRDKPRMANVYIIKGQGIPVDGSGQVRAENASAIIEQVPSILLEQPPTYFNIVLSSGAGGSGGVIASSLVSAMLKAGERVMAFVIGSKETDKHVENTLNTILSYEGVSRLTKRPIVMYYEENSTETPRAAVDKRVLGTVAILRALFSGQNHELDSMDLNNWLNYDRVTSYKPRLTSLNVLSKESEISPDTNYISVATLAQYDQPTQVPGFTPEYQCVGFVPAGTSDLVLDHLPVHFVINENGPSRIASSLKKVQDQLAERKNSRSQVDSIFDQLSPDTEVNGLVL